MTHKQALKLWQDVMSASSDNEPGLGAQPGPSWVPHGGHLQPSTQNIKPNQLGSFSRYTNLFHRTESNKPRDSRALHKAQQNPQASGFQYNPTAQWVRWLLSLQTPPAQAQFPVSCVTLGKLLIPLGPQVSHLSSGNNNSTYLTESS